MMPSTCGMVHLNSIGSKKLMENLKLSELVNVSIPRPVNSYKLNQSFPLNKTGQQNRLQTGNTEYLLLIKIVGHQSAGVVVKLAIKLKGVTCTTDRIMQCKIMQ